MTTQEAIEILDNMGRGLYTAIVVAEARDVVLKQFSLYRASVREALEWLRQGDRGRAVEALERVKL